MINSLLPLVSVIVPSYNHGQFIESTIISIVKQTYKNIELIVIDDGSTDNSIEILEKLSSEFNFKFIRQKNIGSCKTLELLFKLSNGKYIMPCASDDICELNRVEIQVNFLENNPENLFCSGNCIMIDEFSKPLNEIFQFKKHFCIYKFEDIYISNKIGAMILIKKELLQDFRYHENFKLEDWYLWLKLLQNGGQCAFLEENLGFYRIHKNNTSKKLDFMHIEKLKIVNFFRPKNNRLYFKALIFTYLHYYFHKVYSIMPFDFGFKRK